jgi:predicted O-methyltransferase YrrM
MDFVAGVLLAAVSVTVNQRTISSAAGLAGLREGAYMVTNTLNSPHVARVLDRLFDESDASEPAWEAVAQSDASRLLTSRAGYREFYGLMKDIPLPVSRETGYLLYMLTRSTGARCVLEFGTSFGVSTIYLAAALRDNGGGRIITTEFEPSKAARARDNLTEAGLIDLVEIREGDALETLAHDLPETLELVLLDGAKPLYADILQRIEGCLRPGSLVLADDARFCQEFVNRMRSGANRYMSVPLAGDLEISMRLS